MNKHDPGAGRPTILTLLKTASMAGGQAVAARSWPSRYDTRQVRSSSARVTTAHAHANGNVIGWRMHGSVRSKNPIALICAVGNRSAFLQGWLRKAGFENVFDVSEGMIGGRLGAGWIKSGLPLRRWAAGATKPQPGAQ